MTNAPISEEYLPVKLWLPVSLNLWETSFPFSPAVASSLTQFPLFSLRCFTVTWLVLI